MSAFSAFHSPNDSTPLSPGTAERLHKSLTPALYYGEGHAPSRRQTDMIGEGRAAVCLREKPHHLPKCAFGRSHDLFRRHTAALPFSPYISVFMCLRMRSQFPNMKIMYVKRQTLTLPLDVTVLCLMLYVRSQCLRESIQRCCAL